MGACYVWAGDVVPYRLTTVSVRSATIAGMPDVLKHFAAATGALFAGSVSVTI